MVQFIHFYKIAARTKKRHTCDFDYTTNTSYAFKTEYTCKFTYVLGIYYFYKFLLRHILHC